MVWGRFGILAVLSLLVVSGCAPAGPSAAPGSETHAEPAATTPAPTLVLLTRTEPATLNRKVPASGSEAHPNGVQDIFHAGFFRFDERRTPLPYLVEALPQLDTESWRVFADGRMETTYRLRPNLLWHDGTPFSADDYVFSLQVYRTTQLGFRTMPQNLIEEI